MSRLLLESKSLSEQGFDSLAKKVAGRVCAMPADQCPVEYLYSLTCLFSSESCGKCSPCRIGLRQAVELMKAIIDGEGTQEDLELLERSAHTIFDSADCAIGFEAGRMILEGIEAFKDDFVSHIESDECTIKHSKYAPCQELCPAHVDVPAYISLINAGRNADAMRVMRNDNPLPTVCGYVCEHPCENACRRALVDSPVNICGLKRYAADNSEDSKVQDNLPSTGKTVAIIGGGPSGLTTAYYLQLMGHQVTIFEQRPKLGGMVRYGIPDYRLPQEKLDEDINWIISTGIQVNTDVSVGNDIPISELQTKYDALCISIGAHAGKNLGIDGEDSRGVLSAVEFLRAAGDGAPIDLTGKRVVIVGGGNVAMDCTRTARRLGAQSVECVYRRRIDDMTALQEEIQEAMAEGCQITALHAPVRIEHNENNCVTGLVVQPQLISTVKWGRPAPVAADKPEKLIPCDVVLIAIGQDIESEPFAELVDINRGKIVTNTDGSSTRNDNKCGQVVVFAGGDAVSGPATVIKAIAQGKVAAANIDEALGFNHSVHEEIELPLVQPTLTATGRVELEDRNFGEAIGDFEISKYGMSKEEAIQESARCLHCKHHGFGIICGEGVQKW